MLASAVILGAALTACGHSSGGDPTQDVGAAQNVGAAQPGASMGSPGDSDQGDTTASGSGGAADSQPKQGGSGRRGAPNPIFISEIDGQSFVDSVKQACGTIDPGPDCFDLTYSPAGVENRDDLQNCQVELDASTDLDQSDPTRIPVPAGVSLTVTLNCPTASPSSPDSSTDSDTPSPSDDQTQPSPAE